MLGSSAAGGPPKAAAGGGGEGSGGADATGLAASSSLRLPKLVPKEQGPTTEYSTLRFSKQQQSSRMKCWDSRKAAVPGLALGKTAPAGGFGTLNGSGGAVVPTPPPGAPFSARGDKDVRRPVPPGLRQAQAQVGKTADEKNANAYPTTARTPRQRPAAEVNSFSTSASQWPGKGGASGSFGAAARNGFATTAAFADLFTLDQEELAGFRLGASAVAGAEGVYSTRGGGPPGQENEEDEGKQADQTPARLLIVRQMYGKLRAAEAENSPTAADAAKGEEGRRNSRGELVQDGLEGVAEAEAADGNTAEATAAEGSAAVEGATPGADEAGAVPELAVEDYPSEEEFDEDAILKRELAKLRTGEDVIAFFAKNGSNTPIKFVYCRRREMQDVTEFRPYDLEVIPEMMETSKGKSYAPSMLGEHFTISNKGVTHLCPGQQSEYMSLGDWMHQCLMYSVLTSMNFFKYYIHGKVFGRWRQHTRYTVYCHHRSRLARRLFLAKPMFVGPIVQLHREMHEVESVKVMSIGSNVYDVEVFESDQTRVRTGQGIGAAKEFELGHDRAVSILNILVKKVSASTEVSAKSDEHSALRPRMKSMVQEKKDAADNARRLQLAKQDQGMLGDCIRLVDYMFQACLVKVVIHAVIDFFQRIENSNKMFSISVSFGEHNMVFDPGLERFLDMLNTLWRGTIQVVNAVPSFLSVRAYDQYVSVQNHQTVESILNSNRDFQKYTAGIRDKIEADIAEAQRVSDKSFAIFRRIHEYGEAWNEEEYIARSHTNDELARDMTTMREFQDDLEKFKSHHNVGIIVVDGKNLRASLTPIPERSLDKMKEALIEIARKKCKTVLSRFEEANKGLDERPPGLGKFADYVKEYNKICEYRDEMQNAQEEVDSMYQLLKQYNVRVKSDDSHHLDVLQNASSAFMHIKTVEAHAYIQEKRDEMCETLQQVSNRIEEEAKDLCEQLNRGQFVAEDAILAPGLVLEELKQAEQVLNRLEERAATYTEYQSLFQMPNSFEFEDVEKAKILFANKHKLWQLVSDWQDEKRRWSNDPFSQLDVEKMNKQVIEMGKTAYILNKALEGDEVSTKIRSMIDEWKVNMPTILELGNPAMQRRHMDKIKQAIAMATTTPPTLHSLTYHNIFHYKDLVSEISGTASGEYALEQQLEKIKKAWQDLQMPIMNHRNQRNLWILADVTDIITLLEDHSVQIQTMMGSRFVTEIRKNVEVWESQIRNASDCIDEWLQVQRAWMYLESIFSAEDIQRQLPTESTKFKGVDKYWKDTLKKVRQSARGAMEAFAIPGLLNGLKKANEQLEQIQKSLEAYLETKRAAFPRFYFLSDDELLSILSQTRNPEAVQEHLCKCFDAINRVTFSQEKKKEIIEMSDMIKETVPFVQPVQTERVPVEKWLGDIEEKMVLSLHTVTKDAVEKYPEDGIHRKDWYFRGYAAQAVIAVDQIMWTKCAEDALTLVEKGEEGAMRANIDFTNRQKEASVKLVRLDLTKLQRVLMGALIVLDVHGISVLQNLADSKCSSVNDFDWSKQLRYYWTLEEAVASDGTKVADDCIVRQTIASVKYAYEYLGNTPRLVVTPLTDKCYMTLTGAIHLNYGGNPAGPAGTGKTETTKDLGKALAVPVIVFNCSDGLDYKIMGRFFSGLAQAGAWSCFDEFNRIQVEVLSVIAQQMLTVTQAIRAKKAVFEFIGREIPLNPRFGVFITMNPGYAGRTELPDNLKSLFRPVAMMVPDYGLIAEIMLYSEGFQAATTLARKMVNLYRLSSEQLSKQDHYDFGMRAVKSVLVMAGQLKRKYPDLEEDVTLIRALRDSNVPKFLEFDLPLFFGIITDLYPRASVPYVDYGSLQKEIEEQLRKAKLQIVPAFVTKIIQLLETQLVRHGVMVVGLTMGGKSTNISILAKALTELRAKRSPDPAHQLTKTFSLNPKSITMEELYGSFNINTGEWSDGLVAILVREAVSDTSENKKWVVFDGPVDAIWIENMNTVLDDNKMLCLANGERIKLPPTMTMIFEVQDLRVASPATVSRCGMVYLEPIQLGWRPLVTTWAENFKEKYPSFADNLRKWTEGICEKVLPFIREECREAPGIPSTDGSLVNSFLRMLSTFISPRHGFKLDVEEDGKSGSKEGSAAAKPPKPSKQLQVLARIYCAFSSIWSLGANLHEASRGRFVEFIRSLLSNFCPEVPADGNLYNLCVNDEDSCFTPVAGIVPPFSFDERVPFFNILVPTVETALQRLLLENLMEAGFHTLFSGETGVGKSVGIQQFLNTAGENFTVATANFSAQTSSANIVDFLENRLERKRKNLLGAPPAMTMLLFVDDVNMPLMEKFGAQPPIELLRQVVDYHGFYDRKKLFWKAVADSQFIAACGPPGGGRMEVTPRLFRHFNMIWMTSLPQDTMHRILSSILSGWLAIRKPDLEDLASPIISATVDVFYKIVSDLLPTPVKCHYTFNLRDPAKMLQGLLMVHVKKELTSKSGLVRLWLHETCRQFRDRLVNEDDRNWFNARMSDNLRTYLKESWEIDSFNTLTYGDFFDRAEKMYVQSPNDQKLLDTFNDYLEEYNSMRPSKMNLVFFKDAQNHLARTARIIRQPRGNALLVGVSGVGRKSMARMAAHMADYVCSSIEITRSYDTNAFREDIKMMMMDVAKNEGKGLVFLFSDTQIVKEAFLEDINNVLNTGEVPNLFLPDEMEQVINLTRPLAKAAGKDAARDTVWQHFVQVIRESLHIVLAFSPVGEGFRARCRQFPALINCATIDWYDPWPEDALISVADRYYREAPRELGIDSMLGKLSQISCTIHASSSLAAESFFDKLRRKTYMTPTSYLELIKLFTDLLGLKMGELSTKLNRYKVGAQRLEETKLIVDQLQKDLTRKQPEIEQSKQDTAKLIIEVDQEEVIAKEKAAACAVDEKEASEVAQVATDIKSECERELNEALPEYNAAIKSLDALDKKDIQEVKNYQKPPPLVETVLCAVCLLMKKKEEWGEAKKLMTDQAFLQNLRDYDKDALSADTRLTGKLQKYVKRDDFQPETVKKVSTAAMSLCMWVRAMDIYARVARAIEPKKEKLAASEQSLAEAEQRLTTKRKELKAVQDKVASLQLQLSHAKGKAEKLEQDAETCKVKLGRAEKLLSGLGNESVRWEAASKALEKNLKFVVGNITLAAGFIAYNGPFTAEFRKDVVATWLGKAKDISLAADPQWGLAEVLCDPAEIREWNIRSLPADDLSIENGIMVTRGRRWPLMIDPQGQGNRWIKKMKKDMGLGVIKLSTLNFLRTLENGIRQGSPILLENVEEVLDPAIEPVLLKQVFKKGGQWLLRLGSEDVPYNDNFSFYITTKMANPHYLPEICIKVTIINFTVTLVGLEDQLVTDVVASERPDLAELRADLVVQIAADKAEMDRLEQLILRLLSEAGDDLLADDKLIVTLAQSKQTEGSCKERMSSAEKSMTEIDEVTEILRPVATRASIIYFVVADLANIDPMYQYSLQFFTDLFQQRLQASEKNENVDKRIEILLLDFTEFIYRKICMGLFEDHKLLFSFLVCTGILRHQVHAEFVGKPFVSPAEWAFFLRDAEAGKGVVQDNEISTTPPRWIVPANWRKLCVLEALTVHSGSRAFEGLTKEIAKDDEWARFADDDRMHARNMPKGWSGKLTAFQRLLVVKSLRKDLLQLCVRNLIDSELGSTYTVPPAFDLMGCYKDSQKTTPIIFVLSAGADPTDTLLKLAREVEYEDKLHFISLGQGQGPKAEKLIHLGRETGDWVCLQNCHLAASWMPALERIQEQQDPDSIDDMYRLWLTSMPSPTFPVPVLQSGIKITNEPPKGLRANLSRTFQDITIEMYEGCTKSREFKKLLFGLAFFHAAILERRKFGAIGWNVPYEWMDSDFQVSREQVRLYLESQPGVPWKTLCYIIAEVNYGGRVTDDKDVRLITEFLKRYFNDGLLEDGYLLSPFETYYAPKEGSLDELRDYVKGLPVDEDPQVFGLHSNAMITAQSESANNFLGLIMSIQPRTSSGGGAKRPEDVVAEISQGFLSRVPKPLVAKQAHESTYKRTPDGGIISLGVFHGQESDRFNVLIDKIRSSLVTLGKAIRGLVVMSAQLEEMFNAFLIQKVPPLWGEPISYPCLKPLNSFFADFEQRVAFMSTWLLKGPPVSFWVPCFYFPQGFMTCAKQVHARKTKIPIDDLVFFTEPTEQQDVGLASAPPDGVNVHGLFLQGAGWSKSSAQMVDSMKGVLFVELPIIWMQVVMQDIFDELANQRGRYTCPLYKTSERRGTLSTTGHSTNFVTYFQLPSQVEDQGHWVRRGVALLCMLDD